MISSQRGIRYQFQLKQSHRSTNSHLHNISQRNLNLMQNTNFKQPRTASISPSRSLIPLGGNPSRNIRGITLSPQRMQERLQQQSEYQKAKKQNNHLRQELYSLLVDLPNFVQTRSVAIGMREEERDIFLNEALQFLKKIASNQELIEKYQNIVAHFRQNQKTITELNQINQQILATFSQINFSSRVSDVSKDKP